MLVADDDPVHRGLMQDLLTPLGFILFTATNGPDCLAMAEACRPDLLLVDIAMPGLDGWRIASRLRAAGHDKLVVIVISADATALRERGADRSDHDDFLSKPIDIPHLLAKIGQHCAIEWSTTESAADASPAPPPRVTLDAAQTASLRALGAIGYVRGIHARLDALDEELPGQREHIEGLRQLVGAFRLDAFMDALGPPPP